MQNCDILNDKEGSSYPKRTVLQHHRKLNTTDILLPRRASYMTGESFALPPGVIFSPTNGSTFNFDENRFLVRTTPSDGAVRKVVPTPSPAQVLYKWNYPTLEGHEGARRMYDSMRSE